MKQRSDRLEKDLAVRSRLAAFWQPTACRISAMPNSTHSSHIENPRTPEPGWFADYSRFAAIILMRAGGAVKYSGAGVSITAETPLKLLKTRCTSSSRGSGCRSAGTTMTTTPETQRPTEPKWASCVHRRIPSRGYLTALDKFLV